jgi:hypothetical protein
MGAGPGGAAGASFAGAETMRWLQWGTTSYQTVIFGLALVPGRHRYRVDGAHRVADWRHHGIARMTYLVVGWDIGTEGLALSGPLGVVYYLGSALLFIWMIWLLIVAWRIRKSVPAASG